MEKQGVHLGDANTRSNKSQASFCIQAKILIKSQHDDVSSQLLALLLENYGLFVSGPAYCRMTRIVL